MYPGTRVGPVGPKDAKIAIVGESPGQDEVRKGKPFVGRSGQVLDIMLESAGISRDDCYITNATKYLPPTTKAKATYFWNKGKATDTLVQGMLELREELAEVRPNVVIALGKVASWALTMDDRITKIRGSVMEAKLLPGMKVIPSYHPAFYLHRYYAMSYKQPLGIWDFAKAKRHSEFPEIIRTPPEPDILINPTIAELNEAEERLCAADELIFDTEWYSPDDLAYIGFAEPEGQVIVVPYISAPSRRFFKNVLGADSNKIIQNAVFDIVALHRVGIPVRGSVDDTMVAFHSCWMDLREKSLGTLTSVYTDYEYYKEDVEFIGRDDDKGQSYCGMDVACTRQAWTGIKEDMARTGAQTGYDITMSIMPTMVRASNMGILCDREELRRLHDKHLEDAAIIQQVIREVAGKEINPRSPKQVQEFVFDTLGIKGRKRSSAQDVLMDIAASETNKTRKTMLTAFIRARQHLNIVSRYLREDQIVDRDGRIRCNWNLAGTRNGRLSTTKPWWPGVPIQTVPDDARSIYIPDPGYIFVGFDLEQAEARVVAVLTRDYDLLDDMESGIDIHLKLASELPFDLSYSELETLVAKKGKDNVPERYLAKRCRHALNYIMGPRTFKLTINKDYLDTGIGITQTEADNLKLAYEASSPGLNAWWNQVRAEIRSNPVMTNAYGRSRRFLGAFSEALHRDAVAFYPQSTIADHTTTIIAQLTQEHPEWPILNHMHDGAIAQVPLEQKDEAIAEMKRIATKPLVIQDQKLLVPAEVKVGPNWRDMKAVSI